MKTVNARESSGEIRHLPRSRALLKSSQVAIGEIVRDLLIGKVMFNFVNQAVRNFMIDQLLSTSSQERDTH